MIKINTKQVLSTFKGEPLKNGEDILTVGTCVSVVLGGQVSNPTMGWILGKKFATEDEVELKAEEVVFIQKELEGNKQWTSLVIGQLLEILDGKKE